MDNSWITIDGCFIHILHTVEGPETHRFSDGNLLFNLLIYNEDSVSTPYHPEGILTKTKFFSYAEKGIFSIKYLIKYFIVIYTVIIKNKKFLLSSDSSDSVF